MNKMYKRDENYIHKLVEKGGPDPEEYDELNNFFNKIGDMVRSGEVTRKEINTELWELLGDAVSVKTMQGKVTVKPHGYAGDYEIIDNIYTKWISPEEQLKKWDYFFHHQPAVKAVRNRKRYLIDLLNEAELENSKSFRVLNAGSGPARDIYEFLTENNNGKIRFDCVDMDVNAIEYSKRLCLEHLDALQFYCRNIFRFRTDAAYDFIWSAGLFDYLNDKRFIFLLKHLYAMVKSGGSLVIGNFSEYNPSRDYMEAGDWYLNYRSQEKLMELVEKCGLRNAEVFIDSEPERVNLFVRIRKM